MGIVLSTAMTVKPSAVAHDLPRAGAYGLNKTLQSATGLHIWSIPQALPATGEILGKHGITEARNVQQSVSAPPTGSLCRAIREQQRSENSYYTATPLKLRSTREKVRTFFYVKLRGARGLNLEKEHIASIIPGNSGHLTRRVTLDIFSGNTLGIILEEGGVMKRAAIVTLVILLMLSSVNLIACISRESVEHTLSVGSNPQIHVDVGNGDIELIVGEAGTIHTTAKLRNPDNIDYDVTQDGDTITVSAKTKSDSRADVTVVAPQNSAFTLNTGSGDVEIEGIQASGQVNTGSGSVHLNHLQGDVGANVGSGDFNLENFAGTLTANTGSGRVQLSDATGSFTVGVGSGGITFRGELIPGGDNMFNTGSGSVVLELTGMPSVAIDLETDDGEVTSELPVDVIESSKYKLVGTIGDGEADLTVHVGSGDIKIK